MQPSLFDAEQYTLFGEESNESQDEQPLDSPRMQSSTPTPEPKPQ